MTKKKQPTKDTLVFLADNFHNHEPRHIDEVIFKDNFHLIVTFRNGTVKDIDAFSFINHKWQTRNFEKIKDNASLFKNPCGLGHDTISWSDDDFADIDAGFLWQAGKTIKKQRKKSAFIKLKELPCGLTLCTHSDEFVFAAMPHFHVFEHDFQAGVVSVNHTISNRLDWLTPSLEKEYQPLIKYLRKNKNLFTQIYNAPTAAEKKKLARQLPEYPNSSKKQP